MPRRHPTVYSKRPFVAAPTNLVVSTVQPWPAGESQLQLTWTSARADYYTEIYFQNGQFRGWVNPGVQTFTDTGLSPAGSYAYFVRHTYLWGVTSIAGGPSNIAAGTTQARMGIPTGLVVSQVQPLPEGLTQLQLTWTNFNAIDYVQVYRNGSFYAHLAPGTASYLDTGCAAGTAYTYQVIHWRLTDQWYSPGASAGVVGATQASFTPPTGLAVGLIYDPAYGTTQLRITWVNNNAGDYIQLFRNGGWIANFEPGTAAFTDYGLTAGTQYYYQVQHYRYTGSGVYFSGLGGPTYGTTQIPFNPPHLDVINNHGLPDGLSKLSLFWTNAQPSDYVQVYRNGQHIGWGNPGDTSFVDTGLTENTAYHYTLRHARPLDQWYVSAESNGYDIATLARPAPPVFTYLAPTAAPGGMSQMLLQWTNNGDPQCYTNVWRYGNGQDWTFVAQHAPGVAAWVDTGLNYNTTYYYYLVHNHTSGVLSNASNQGAAPTLDHLRFIMNAGPYAGQTFDITANGMGLNAYSGQYHQGNFNRQGSVNWYGCAGGGGGGGGRADYNYLVTGFGGGGGGGGSGASHPSGTARGVYVGWTYHFEIGAGGGGGRGNSNGNAPGSGAAGGRTYLQEHNGSSWNPFMWLEPGGGGEYGSNNNSARAPGGGGGSCPLSIGVVGGAGGAGGASLVNASVVHGLPGTWGGANSGGGGGGAGYYFGTGPAGNGGYAENGAGGGAGAMQNGGAGGNFGDAVGGAPAVSVGAPDPCGGGGGAGACIWGSYGGGGGGGGGVPASDPSDPGGGGGGRGAVGVMLCYTAE